MASLNAVNPSWRALLENTTRKMHRPVPARMLLLPSLLLLSSLLLLLGSAVAQDRVHPEWCAGPGTFGDDGERCPMTRTEATPCPAGCFVKVAQSRAGESTAIAVTATIVVVVVFVVGFIYPIMNSSLERSPRARVADEDAAE